jgi:hypothetical protein
MHQREARLLMKMASVEVGLLHGPILFKRKFRRDNKNEFVL